MAMPIFSLVKNAFDIPKEGAIPFQRNIWKAVNLLQFDKFAGKRTQHQATTLGTKVTGKKTVETSWVQDNYVQRKELGRQTGFEPATPGTTSRCSNQLSYYRHKVSTLK